MKKRNQKILALLLAVSTAMSMSSPVFAEEEDHSGKDFCNDDYPDAYIGVYGNYLDVLKSDKILSVDVEWTSMNFKYAATQQGTWDPSSHTYEDGVETAAWLNDDAVITISNHSNMAVTASLSYTPGQASGVTGSFGKETLELATAEGRDRETNTPSEKTMFTVGGSMSEGDTDLGTITVSVGDSESFFSGLDLSTEDSSDWASLLQTYFEQHDPDKTGTALNVKLGVGTITSTQAKILSDAVYAYYDSEWGGKVALTIQDATEIADKAFQYNVYGWNAIKLPNVTKIGSYAFMNGSKIQSFYLPKCTSIGDYAFAYCGSCTEVIFGSNIEWASGKEFGDEPNGAYDNFYGTATNTENITLTIGSTQGDTRPGASGIYYTTVGTPGEFMNQTFKEVKRAN